MNPLPCPFCQQPPRLSGPMGRNNSFNVWAIACDSGQCGVNPFTYGATEQAVIEKWNHRAWVAA